MQIPRGSGAFVAAATLMIGGVGLVGAPFAIPEPPAWVFLTMTGVGAFFGIVGGIWLVAMPAPNIRRWWLYHFPGPKNYGTGDLKLKVTWDRAYLPEYDKTAREGRVVIEGLRIRNRRREPLTLNVQLIFYPGDRAHAGSFHEIGPEKIDLKKRGRIFIPRLSCRTNPPTKATYLAGVAKLVLSTPGYGREMHIRLFDDPVDVIHVDELRARASEHETRTNHPALFEIQRLSADINAAINKAVWLIEHIFAGLLSDDEVRDDIRVCKKSLEALAAVLSNSGGADDVQDSIYTLYIDYQKVREWIAEGLRRGGDSFALERLQELGAWHDVDQFLDALRRLMDTDPFVRLARKLRFYGGPNPQFGIKTLPPAPGATAGLFAFGLIREPGEGEPGQLQDSIETLKGERPET